MEWNEQRALSLAAQARSSLKLSAGHNQLLRIGHNALVLFKGTPYVARIAGSHGQDVASPNEVAIAWHLLDHGVPAITPADFASLELEGHVVTIWHYHQPREGDTQPEPEQLVELMWTLQRAMESYPLQLPEWTPLSRIDSWLDFLREDPSLPAVDWELLSGWRERLAQRLPSVCSRLGVGPVHGDLDGNVFMTAEGPRICDFENVCLAPRELDLVTVAVNAFHFAGRAHQRRWQRFVAACGCDVTEWDGWEVLCRWRLLQVTLWRLACDHRAEDRSEALNRLSYWQRDLDANVLFNSR